MNNERRTKILLINAILGYLPPLTLIGYMTHWSIPFALLWLLAALNIENKYS